MSHGQGYPVMLNIIGKRCVIVGGGKVSARKTAGLLDSGAQVTVISPVLDPDLQRYADDGQVQWISRAYESGLLTELRPFLVFAATDSPEVNRQVAEDANAIPVLVNIADDPTNGDFHNMMSVRRNPITVALSTGGASPGLSKRMKQRIEEIMSDDYAIIAQWLGEIRPQIKTQLDSQSDRAALYNAILDSDIPSLLSQNQTDAAYDRLHVFLKERVHD
jgi:precorrin-2 dehydrogenase/sirohydrochlorin ferrochelatase